MPACVPQAKSAKPSDTAAGKGKAGSQRTAAGKAKSPHKSAKPSDTAAGKGKAGSPHTAAGKAKSPHKSAKPSDTAVGKGKAWSPHTAAAKSSNTAAGIPPASETPYHIKDAVLRELIGLGKVQVVTRSSKLSRSGK